MGGFAAKQRRRLQRQSLQPMAYQSSIKASSRTEMTASMNDHRRANAVSVQNGEAPKKKLQKPKHLKRKLESIEKGGNRFSKEEQELLFQQAKELQLMKVRRKVATVAKEQADLEISLTAFDTTNKKSKGNDQKHINQQQPATGVSCFSKVEIEQSSQSKGVRAKTENDQDTSRIDENSDDDDDLHLDTKMSRQRGKRLRRRCRTDNSSSAISDGGNGSEITSDDIVVSDDSMNANKVKPSESDSLQRGTTTRMDNLTNDFSSSTLRRCIGRKPVTDFKVGQCYSGKVVYAKSYGVFFDIGCHSDAFCHVSQLSDKFIESPIDSFPVGQVTDKIIRVLAIDRRKKRLTVSLQQPSCGRNSKKISKNGLPSVSHDEQKPYLRESSNTFSVESSNFLEHVNAPSENRSSKSQVEPENESRVSIQDNGTEVKSFPLESMNCLTTEEQLKRTRKIARRAQRRAEKEMKSLAAPVTHSE